MTRRAYRLSVRLALGQALTDYPRDHTQTKYSELSKHARDPRSCVHGSLKIHSSGMAYSFVVYT
jgi:hypothetical protein